MKVLCFEIKYTGSFRSEWKKLALMGPEYRIRAIKACREHGLRKNRELMGLRESIDMVDEYIKKHYQKGR